MSFRDPFVPSPGRAWVGTLVRCTLVGLAVVAGATLLGAITLPLLLLIAVVAALVLIVAFGAAGLAALPLVLLGIAALAVGAVLVSLAIGLLKFALFTVLPLAALGYVVLWLVRGKRPDR